MRLSVWTWELPRRNSVDSECSQGEHLIIGHLEGWTGDPSFLSPIFRGLMWHMALAPVGNRLSQRPPPACLCCYCTCGHTRTARLGLGLCEGHCGLWPSDKDAYAAYSCPAAQTHWLPMTVATVVWQEGKQLSSLWFKTQTEGHAMNV